MEGLFIQDTFHSNKSVHRVDLFNPDNLDRKKLIANSYTWYSQDPFLKEILHTEVIYESYYGVELRNVPDALYTESMKIYDKKGYGSVLRRSQKITSAFLQGFGDAALEQGDYVTAINAYDVTSTNGILRDEVVMARLKDIAQREVVVGVRIAQAIQARIQKTELSASS